MAGKKRVVITGLGMATSLGLDVETCWQKAIAGTSGIRKITLRDTGKSAVQAVGEITGDDLDRIKAEFPDDSENEGEKRTLFALWSARCALRDAGLISQTTGQGTRTIDTSRFGVTMAAGLGLNRLEDIGRWTGEDGKFDYARFSREYRDVCRDSIIKNNSNRPAALIAKKFGFSGYNATITTACASASQAIGTAYRTISRGNADVIVAGGADSMINPVGLVFFVLLSAAAVSTEDPSGVCRPFDRKRSGLVMGEGAGVAVLEEESHARNRGARIYAEVAGYSSTLDAYKVTAPHPQGIGAEHAMRNALADADMAADQMDYINAHGTSTKLNDAAETAAIRKVFKDHAYRLAVNSSKSVFGHLLAASGGPEFVFTALSVQRDKVHPTLNLNNPDPKCDLDYVPHGAMKKNIRAAISNSFGFGGQNASIVIKKYEG